MKTKLQDRKSTLAHMVLGPVNRLLIKRRFDCVQVTGHDNIPAAGPFILVCNHLTRWDGLLIGDLIARPCNYMVSPNELSGWQGLLLPALGSFPADAAYDLVEFTKERMASGEGLVIFPEGNLYADGVTHRFKRGAARIALSCQSDDLKVPLIPAAIHYDGTDSVSVNIGAPVELGFFRQEFALQANQAVHELTLRLHREVCCLRESLGATGDSGTLYAPRRLKVWVRRYPEAGKVSYLKENERKHRELERKLVGAGAGSLR